MNKKRRAESNKKKKKKKLLTCQPSILLTFVKLFFVPNKKKTLDIL